MTTLTGTPYSGSWSLGLSDHEASPLGKFIADKGLLQEEERKGPKIIGLAGRARSGKDTIGFILKDEFLHVNTVAFAQAIRDGMRAMFGFTDEHFNGDLKEAIVPWIGKSPRYMMQTIGTEWGRKMINEDIWLLIVQRKILEAQANGEHTIITDVRFENEAKLIRDLGGQVWHVIRADAPVVNAHASEAGVMIRDEDIVIYNNGTVEDLRRHVVDLFE